MAFNWAGVEVVFGAMRWYENRKRNMTVVVKLHLGGI